MFTVKHTEHASSVSADDALGPKYIDKYSRDTDEAPLLEVIRANGRDLAKLAALVAVLLTAEVVALAVWL
jgi:uncharacterized protein YprB with RNaseH-like and TPR domain